MQMPNETIDIIDNSTYIGKNKVCKLIDKGCKPVGTIESELPVLALKAGFEHNLRTKIDELDRSAQLAREALNGNIAWEQVHPIKEGSETP
jgi:hypothetical protein